MNKYRHFFHHNLDLACFANLDGDFEELNENFTKVLGYTNEELLGKKFFEFIHPGDIPATQRVMNVLAGGHKAANFISRFRTKSNGYKYLEWDSLVDPGTGKIYAIARDVTGKMLAEKEHCRQAKEIEQHALELFIANEELSFQNEEKEKRAFELLVANKELSFQNGEKEKRATELNDANKTLKRTKDFLRQYIRGMEEIMFMTSHKVRQPIANILGVVNLLDKSLSSPDEMTKLLGFIKKSALDLDMFTKDLINYMKNLGKPKAEKPGITGEHKPGV
jgi:PAS domain S-box-containing protein